MRDGFQQVRAEIKEEMTAEIKAEGETTRRHFDIMVERVNDSVRLVAEGTAHHGSRLDNHEKRLKALEKPRRA
jgi:phage protein U